MSTKKATKRALLTSILAICLCLVMLIGSTFAWFTDTASTGVNKIVSGKLDVELEYSTDCAEWKTADTSTKLFDDNALWEPGHTQIVYLRVKNAGNLALKYTIGWNSQIGFTNGVNVFGDTYNVGDYLKCGAATVTGKLADREAAWAAVGTTAVNMKDAKPFADGMPVLEAGQTSAPIAVVVYMPTDVGNEANAGTKASYVYRMGVEVYATQATVENDSFGNTYDENAPTKFKADSSSSETIEVTENIQASGRFGVVQAEKTAKYTINADLYAVYTKGGGLGAAMAVSAAGTSEVIINGGTFAQVGVPADDPCDLIYADGSAKIYINGGTFKATQPERTLNCKDGSSAQIIVSGGSFYKYDPSNPTLGDNEVVVATGYEVIKDGDWFKVVPTTTNP